MREPCPGEPGGECQAGQDNEGGGVMNLAWVAALGIAVLAEKYGPAGTPRAIAAGGLGGAVWIGATS